MDYSHINKDPKLFCKNHDKETLIRFLYQSRYKYYNDPKGSMLSDASYDFIENYVEKKYQYKIDEVGANAPSNSIKCKLPCYMPSINKIKTEKEINHFMKSSKAVDYIISDKLDGISLLVFKDQNNNMKAVTRGNGLIGRDISWITNHIKLGNLKQNEYVRGELIISRDNWNIIKHLYPHYSNSRNFIAGYTNQKHINESILHLFDFIAFEFISDTIFSFKEQFGILHEKGFKQVYYFTLPQITRESLSKQLHKRLINSTYDIDGLIISRNQFKERVTQDKTYPVYSKAFKENTKFKVSRVISISWNPSMYGVLKPIVNIEKIVIDGINIENISGHNARYIVENKIGPGTIIQVTRSGDVIPLITNVIKISDITGLPSTKKIQWIWDRQKVNIILRDSNLNREVKIKRLEYFLSCLKTKGIKKGIISKLAQHSILTPHDFLKLTKQKLDTLKIKGIGTKMMVQIHNEIKRIKSGTHLVDVMTASLCFGHGFSKKKLNKVVETIPDIMNKDNNIIHDRLQQIKGFSTKSIQQFLKGLKLFKTFIKNLDINIIIQQVKDDKKESVHKILFSGIRPTQDIKQKCQQLKFEIMSTFSKKITLLIVKSKDKTTQKITKATQNNIPIMTYDKFNQYILSL